KYLSVIFYKEHGVVCKFEQPTTNKWWFTLCVVLLSAGLGTWFSNFIYSVIQGSAELEYVDHGKVSSTENKEYHIFVIHNSGGEDGIITKIKLNNKEEDDFLSSHALTDPKLRKHSMVEVAVLVCPAKKYCEISLPYTNKEVTSFEFFNGKDWVESKI
ncbi:hypothetical protein, partial [Vibrio splendidus]|uniref:hypothetical protein n=1 Tax=Vibrio splendidus TaxID=29497 RepID=UPI001A7E09FA